MCLVTSPLQTSTNQLRSKQMSTGLSGVLNSSTIHKAKDVYSKPVPSYNQFASTSGISSVSTTNVPLPLVTVNNPLAALKKGLKSNRTPEELEIIQQTAERYYPIFPRLAQCL